MERLRVCSLQYYIRPIQSFDQFRDQVVAMVETAADYGSRLIVFPEYFTIQLITLEHIQRPMPEQVRDLARKTPRFLELMGGLAQKHKVYIVAGTIPTLDPADENTVHNDAFVFSPSGNHHSQGKIHLTRWEKNDWKVSPRETLRIFEADFGRFAVAICYDVEFPEIARAAARNGANILVVPSCTDDRLGFLRVRYCSHARAIENQMYVIQSSTVGSIPMIPTISLNYGQSAILTPSDFPFSRDGILAEGLINAETMVIGDLNLVTIAESRSFGSVLPLNDSARTAQLVAQPHIVPL
jgi:predicted amidohydrolase